MKSVLVNVKILFYFSKFNVLQVKTMLYIPSSLQRELKNMKELNHISVC